MPACLRCRTLVDTNVLLYELCCSVQGRLKAVLLCLRYVDIVAFSAWFVPAWCAHKKRIKAASKTKTPWLFVILLHIFGNQSWWYSKLSPRRALPLQSCSPRGWYSPVPWLGLKRAPVSPTWHAHTNTHPRASCCCYDVLRIIIAVGCGAAAIDTTTAA